MSTSPSAEVEPDHPDARDDEKYLAFERWLREAGARDRTVMRRYAEDIRGVHAAETIEAEEMVCELPLKTLITVEMGKATKICQDVIAARLDFDGACP